MISCLACKDNGGEKCADCNLREALFQQLVENQKSMSDNAWPTWFPHSPAWIPTAPTWIPTDWTYTPPPLCTCRSNCCPIHGNSQPYPPFTITYTDNTKFEN